MNESPFLNWKVDAVELSNVDNETDRDVVSVTVEILEVQAHVEHAPFVIDFVLELNPVSFEIEHDAALTLNELADLVELRPQERLVNSGLG
jgi:hypothetical protein